MLLLLLLALWPCRRTVADGTCRFPQNMFGCETAAAKYTGGVKFIADDYAMECEVRTMAQHAQKGLVLLSLCVGHGVRGARAWLCLPGRGWGCECVGWWWWWWW